MTDNTTPDSEKIGELKGQITGINQSLKRHDKKIDQLFDRIDQSTEKIRIYVQEYTHGTNKKIEQIKQDTDPVVRAYSKQQKQKNRSMYERTEIKIIVGAAVITWLGGCIIKGIQYLITLF
jgi:predicted  nucleic acid-binding Zn-ribbon protein